MTILLLGVDARPGEAIDVGVRADAMGLLHLDPEDRSCRLLAIPRDARAELPGYGPSKINHALAVGGVPYQVRVVEAFLGVSVDRYALADFRGFAAVVDAIGGVTLTVSEPIDADEFSFQAGEHHFTGNEALAYVQYRGGSDGDFGRITRQQQMLRAIADQATGLDLVRSLRQILPAVESHLRTDLSLVELTSLIAYYQASCESDEIAMETLAGETATFVDPLVGQELSYVIVSDEEKAARLATLLGENE
jgi:LCP family protein required for cell wall assembly